MNLAFACPAPEQLRAFRTGPASDEAAAGVEEHLAGCPRCLAVLSQPPGEEDDLLRDLREQPRLRLPANAVVEGLRQKLRGLPLPTRAGDSTGAHGPDATPAPT